MVPLQWDRIAAAQPPSDQVSQVDALMSRWVHVGTPGAAVIVVRHGQVLLEKGYGLADVASRVPVTPRTVFDIASLSKPFTAMAALILAEHGTLHQNDSLGEFFPGFSAEARAITIGQLLSHTSGLADYTRVWGETRPVRGTARTSENVIAFLEREPLRFAPGERWEYSNSNYVVLAQIVSKVAREPFPQYVRAHIFQPLAMNDSFVYERGAAAGATGYTGRSKGAAKAARNPENYVYGDGQVKSSVDDLAKWARALSPGALIGAATLKEALAPAHTEDGTAVNYGFGWGLGRYRGASFVGHGGETDGFVAQFTHFPAPDLTVILLANDDSFPAPFAIANRIAGIFLAGELKTPAPILASTKPLGEYVGAYALYDLVLTIRSAGNALWLASPGRDAVKLVPVSDEEFLLDGTDGGSSLLFHRNAAGKVTALSLLDQNGTTFWRRP